MCYLFSLFIFLIPFNMIEDLTIHQGRFMYSIPPFQPNSPIDAMSTLPYAPDTSLSNQNQTMPRESFVAQDQPAVETNQILRRKSFRKLNEDEPLH
jgi:hypothetical protein